MDSHRPENPPVLAYRNRGSVNKRIWNWVQLSVLILPIIPALGEAGLVLSLLSIGKHHSRQILQYRFNWGLGIFSLGLILNACFAFKPQEAWLGLPNFLPFIALLAAFSLLIQDISQLRQLAWLLVLPSFPIVILGLGQLFLAWKTPEWFINLVGWTLVEGGEPDGRMSSVFMYANILAAYLLMVLILALGLWFDTYTQWRRKRVLTEEENRENEKIFSFFLLPFSFPVASLGWKLGFITLMVVADGIGLILTSSRNAWGLALIACLSFALYLGWRWIVLGVVALISSILWASFGNLPGRDQLRQVIPAYFWARLSDEMYPNRPVATLRTTLWNFAWDMMIQRPWTGWGLRNFTPLYKAQMGIWLGHPHNFFLMLLAEIGIPGTLLLLSLVGWLLLQASLLLQENFQFSTQVSLLQNYRDKLILFTYLVAFWGCTLFNSLDVTIFDLRVNTIGWLLLAGISGIVYKNLFI